MPYETIAEGRGWADLRDALANIQPGQNIELELTFDRDLTDEELVRADEKLGFLVDAKLLSNLHPPRNGVLRLTVRVPTVQEHVGFVWFLPLLAIGGILTGLAGWRIMTARPADMLRVLIPVALVGLGAWLIYNNVRKWPRERNE